MNQNAAKTTKLAHAPRIKTAEVDEAVMLAVKAARQQFFEEAINMGWQLAATIIVPVFIGVRLDDHFHTTPSWTLTAMFLSVFIACGVVWKTLHGLTVAQVSRKSKSRKKEKTT